MLFDMFAAELVLP